MESVALLERAALTVRSERAVSCGRTTGGWSPRRDHGRARSPERATPSWPVSDGVVLVLRGRVLPASDQRVLTAFAAQVGVALEQARLAEAAAAAKPLAEADRMRTALLAAVSHDLRTPLASAKAAVTSLRSHDVDWSPEDSDELLATADESLDRLTRMVENLLDMSRLQAGALSLSLRPVTLDEIVPLALDGLGFGPAQVQLIEHGRRRRRSSPTRGCSSGSWPTWCPTRSGTVPPGQPVLITASSLAGRVELRVADRGPGIPREDRERVFQPFQRFGDRDNETGVGLGLALSRGLVEAMGGSLEPEDTPGGGLTMVISLPVGGTAGTADSAQAVPAAPRLCRPRARTRCWRRGRRRVTRVLVVDDEPQLLRALRINLRARHYDVETAPDGATALAAAARCPPDLVILDLGLPDLDGVQVIEGLRGWSRVPIIVLSGRADPAGKVGALDAGADDYVTKPFHMDELLARVRSALRRSAGGTEVATFTLGPPCDRSGCPHDHTRRGRKRQLGSPMPAVPRPTAAVAPGWIRATAGGAPAGSAVAARWRPGRIRRAAAAAPRGPAEGASDRRPGPVRLTPTEWGVLEILLRNAGKLVPARQLLSEVWGPKYQHETHYLRFYLARLRRKLEPDPSRPRYLINEPGMGYRYEP